jgi:hypothetical protein
MIDQQGDPAYVEILDLQECKMIPFDAGLTAVALLIHALVTDPEAYGHSKSDAGVGVRWRGCLGEFNGCRIGRPARSMLTEHSRTDLSTKQQQMMPTADVKLRRYWSK